MKNQTQRILNTTEVVVSTDKLLSTIGNHAVHQPSKAYKACGALLVALNQGQPEPCWEADTEATDVFLDWLQAEADASVLQHPTIATRADMLLSRMEGAPKQ